MQHEAVQSSDTEAEAASLRFSEELLRFCERAYKVEGDRKEEMEKKAQYYLALITGLLGILAFKGEAFNLNTNAGLGLLSSLRGGIGALIFAMFLLSILVALFCMMKVLAPRRYEKPYPNSLVTFLFRAPAQFETNAELILDQAKELALAAEINFEHNLGKSKWLSRLSKSVFAILVLLLLLLVVTNL